MWIINFFKNLIFGKKEAIIPKDPGLLESPPDYRDVLFGAVKKKFTPLPETYRIPYELTISNQGNTPHCVGHSSATLKAERERREGNFIDFDGSWIYKEAKKIDGAPNVWGTYFRAGLKVLQKQGAMPLEGGDPSMYRIGGYIRVPTGFESLKQAIHEHGVVLAGFTGSNQGWKNAYIRRPNKGERTWGHAVSLIGWNKEYIIGQNSFGKNWGDKGYFYFDKRYLPFSAWAVIVDLPSNWKELLGEDKTKPVHQFNRNLWIGLRNDEVKDLQECLKYLGCFPNMDCTTYFGRITKEAVITFQKRFSIEPARGFVGPLTREQLNKLFS